MDRVYILEKQNIKKAILNLCSPSAISTTSTVIYNIVDAIFIGRFVGAIGIAAISLYLPIQMMILSLALLFAAGVASFISRELGRKDYDLANKAFGTLICFVSTLSIVLFVFLNIFTTPILHIFGAYGNVFHYTYTYAKCMFIGILFYPLTITSNNVLRSEGSAKYSMYGTIISISSNIVLDFFFIAVFHMGIFGAGIATTISKLFNLIYVAYVFKKKSTLKINLKYITYDFKLIGKCIPIGFSTCLNQLLGSLSMLLLNRDIYHFGGDYAIAVYGVVYKLTSLIQRSIGGFNRGGQPLIGYNFGAKNIKRVKESVKWLLIISSIISLVATVFVLVFSKPLVLLFTSHVAFVSETRKVLIIALLGSPFLGIYFLSISFYRAIGCAKESILLSLFRRVIFFIPLIYIFPYMLHMGILGIWITLPLSNILAATFGGLFLLHGTKKYIK